jgi:DNA-binding SARP family transcriptional activator
MSTLAINLLGPPRLQLDGDSLSLKTRKALALLAYLAVTAQLHDRDALAELLFPDADRERGRSNHRQALFVLRAAIGGSGLPLTASPSPWRTAKASRWTYGDPASREESSRDVYDHRPSS